MRFSKSLIIMVVATMGANGVPFGEQSGLTQPNALAARQAPAVAAPAVPPVANAEKDDKTKEGDNVKVGQQGNGDRYGGYRDGDRDGDRGDRDRDCRDGREGRTRNGDRCCVRFDDRDRDRERECIINGDRGGRGGGRDADRRPPPPAGPAFPAPFPAPGQRPRN